MCYMLTEGKGCRAPKGALFCGVLISLFYKPDVGV